MKNKFLSMLAYAPIAEPCAAKSPQNTGGGNSQCSVLQYESALLIPTVNRRSTDGQSQSNYPLNTLKKAWKYVACMLMVLFVGIGNMWGDETINLFYGTSKAVDGNNVNHEDFVFSRKATIKTGQTSQTIGTESFTHYLELNGYGANSLSGADTSKVIYYHTKTTSTKITVYIKNGNSSKKKYYIDHLFEGETTVADGRKYEKELAKSSENGNEKKEYTVANTEGKNVVIGVMPGQNGYIYQIVVEENGTPLLKAGEDGYSLTFPGRFSSLSAFYPVQIDEKMTISPSNGLKCLNGPLKIKQETSYVKFELAKKTIVSVTPYNARKFIFCAAATPTTEEKATANLKGGTGAVAVETALAAGTWYLESENTSELQLSGISFFVPKVSYDANGGSGTMAATEWTVAANGFTAPEGKKFDKWTKNADGTGGDVAVGFETEENLTLYAQWKDDVPVYGVTYNLNGATGTTPTETDKEENEVFTLHNGVTGITAPDTKVFGGWNDGTSTYAGGAEYTMGKDPVEFTAQWVNTYAVTYNKGANGTGDITGGSKAHGLAYTLSSERFTRAGYVQVGWALTDGGTKAYELGGSYTTDAAQEFFPVWAETSTYVASFDSGEGCSASTPDGWTFANAGSYGASDATADFECKFGSTCLASGSAANASYIAFAKSPNVYATYDLSAATTVAAVTGTFYVGSSSARTFTIDYLGADGTTVLHTITVNHPSGSNWGADNVNETAVVDNVRYIKVKGMTSNQSWIVMSAFSVTYVDLVPKYDLAFAKNGGSGADMATLRYAEDANVALPACTFTAPENKEFDAWVVTKTASGNPITVTDGKFTMPAEAVTATATWKFLPKLTLEAGEGATGDAVVTYHKAGSSVAVPAKPEGFSKGTSSFTGWVYSSDVEITDGAFPMPSSDLTLTAQWASATAVAQIVGGDSYETFAAAIAAVTDGQTIQLLQDIDVDAQIEIAGVDITIDLNGHKIEYVGDATLPSGVILVHNGASLTINDSSDPEAGSIVSGDKAYAAVALTKLGDDASTPATLVVNGGALTGYYYGITGNGSRNNTVITINGGTITGTVGIAIYHPQVGILTVNDGSLTGVDAAIEMRAGTLVINDGTFTATATEFSCNPNGSGSTTSGAAIAIAQHTTKKEISVTINGGTFNGVKALNESNPQVNDPAPQVTMAVTAGTFTGEVTTVDVNNFISGGTFDHEVAANQCAEGYAPKDNGDNTYGVKPLATSIDFVAFIDANGTSGSWATYLSDHNYTLSSTSDVSLDGGNNGAADKGLKIKKTGRTITFDVAAGKLVTLKVGSLDGGAQISENGGEFVALTGANPLHTGASVKTYYYSADVANYVIKTVGDAYNIIQSVTIEDPYVVTFNANGGEEVAEMEFHGTALTLPSATKGTEVFKGWYDAAEAGNLIGKAGESYTPTASVTLHAQWEAVSTDNTLSALEVDNVALADFDPDKHIYNIVCEYGHTPQITLATATAADQGATVSISNTPVHYVDENNDFWYVQANVTPASGTPIGYNQVRYTNKPKQGVTLIKATHDGTATGATVTGYLGGTYDKNTASDGKLGGANTYFGIKLAEGNFQAGDVLYIHANTVSSAVRIYSDKGTTRINAEDGTFDANKMFTYTLTAETEWIYIYRKVKDGESDMNPYVDYIEVQRYMDPFIESFEIEGIGALDINPTTKAITASVPESFDVTNLEPTIKAWANGSAHLDKSGAQDFTDPVTYTVTSDYAEDGEVTYTVTITKVAPSATPTITTQPAGANYVEGASVAALEVEATGAGTLSYQWQVKNGEEWENIDDAVAASYTPAVSAIGSYTYRVVVTNTEESKPATSVNSNEAVIVIAEDPSCKAIGYGTTRDLALNTEVVIDAATGLKHKSSKDAVEGSRKIKNVSDIDGIKLDGNAYYDIYTTEMNIGSIAVSLTSNSNGTNRKFAVIFCSAAEFDAAKILGIVEQTGGAGDEEQVINTPDVPLGTKLVRIMRYYKDANNNEYGEASSSWIYYARVCLVEPAQEVTVSVTAEPASANYCPEDVVAPLAYELSMEEGASAAYQWYKGTTAIENATEATYTPSETGVYSCKAVVTKTGRLNKKLTSAEATVNFYEATEITGFENAAAPLNTEKTLSVTAAGTGTLTYKWQACTEAGVVTDENVLSSAAAYDVTITEEPQYYLVTVEGECGSATQVLFAKKWADLELVDVDGSMTWNFAASNTGITADVTVPSTMVLANAGQGAMPNTDNFHSDMLKAIVGSTGTAVRKSTDDGCYQGTGIMFHTTVPGIVTVTYRGTGNNANVTLTVGSKTFDTYHGGFTTCDKVFVPAGDVEISSVGTMRIQKIVFNAEPDYTRSVTEGRYGTICLPNGGVMVGATIYTLAYYGETSQKIFFDEVVDGTMEAGKPYLFLPNEGINRIGVFYTDAAGAEAQTVNGFVGYIGASEDDYTQVPAGEGNYIVQNNQYREILAGATAYILSHRAYIHFAGINTSEPAKAPGARRIGISGAPQVATGMDALNTAEAPVKVMIDGQLFILRGEKMYDATGRLVK